MKKIIENKDGVKEAVEFMDYGRKYESGSFLIVKEKGENGDVITVTAKSGLFSFSVKDKDGRNQPFFILDYGLVHEELKSLVEAYILNVFCVGNIVQPQFHSVIMTAVNAYLDNVAPLADNPDADKRAVEIDRKMNVVRERIDDAIEKMKIAGDELDKEESEPEDSGN